MYNYFKTCLVCFNGRNRQLINAIPTASAKSDCRYIWPPRYGRCHPYTIAETSNRLRGGASHDRYLPNERQYRRV